MYKKLRVLIVEDSATDAELTMYQLDLTGCQVEYELVDTAPATRRALGEKQWDIILCDFSMPNFDPYKVLDILRETDLDIPLIVISGKIGEDNAIKLLKAGCHDCIMKSDLRRLPDVINREINEALVRKENRELIKKLQKYQILCDAANDIMLFIDTAGNILDANSAAVKCYGYSLEELLTKNILDLRHITDKELVNTQLEAAIAGNIVFETIHYRKDDTPFFVEVSSQGVLLNGQKIVFSIVRDITERKKSEELLRDHVERYRVLSQTSMDGFYITDIDGRLREVNDAYCKMSGYSSEELLTMNFSDLAVEETKVINATQNEIIKNDGVSRFETKHRRADGTIFDVQINVTSIASKGLFLCFVSDITKRKQDEAELQYERNMAQMYLDTAGVMIIVLDRDGRINLINHEGCAILKVKKKDVLGKNWIDSFVPDSARKDVKQVFDKIIAGGINTERFHENVVITADGEERILLWHNNTLCDTAGNMIGLLSSGTDITERKQAEYALVESENLFRTSFDSAIAGICMIGNNGMFMKVNDKACTILGYSKEELLQLKPRDITYEEDKDIGTSLVRKMISDESDNAVFEKRYIRKDGTVIWVLVSISAIRNSKNDFEYFLTYFQDITESKVNTERVNRTLEGTIETLALVVEAKDPYTAGHQKRVAEIAVAIAEKLGLPQWQIHGLYLASIVHDLGKIQIPSEILNKPGKLTNIEFELIKCHPETAYNLLKDIDFPWPIAEIVYQHHERINGSGYPRKLTADSISIEAKILCVADVIEAMSSYRPYRPAFPMEVAIAEIKKYKGIYYDTDVVEAYLNIIANIN